LQILLIYKAYLKTFNISLQILISHVEVDRRICNSIENRNS